jgi:hypothetical protein
VLATWAHGFNLVRAFADSVASGATQAATPRFFRTNRTMFRAIIVPSATATQTILVNSQSRKIMSHSQSRLISACTEYGMRSKDGSL